MLFCVLSVQSASGVQSGGASASTGDADGIVASSVASSRSDFAAGLRLVTVTASSAEAFDFDLDREAPEAENTAAVCVAGEGGAVGGAHGDLRQRWSVASRCAHVAGVRGLARKLGSRVGRSKASRRPASIQ